MKTYTVLYAEDVPHYGTAEITAANPEEAIAAAKRLDVSEQCTDPDWSNSACRRIVHIEDPDGNTFAEGVALDNCFLRHGGEPERLLCDAAPKLLDALTQIAAIPLWGERITDEQLKADLLHTGEYDSDEDEFTPGCDLESSSLHDAVKIARAALAEARGTPAMSDDATQPQTEGN